MRAREEDIYILYICVAVGSLVYVSCACQRVKADAAYSSSSLARMDTLVFIGATKQLVNSLYTSSSYSSSAAEGCINTLVAVPVACIL